MVEEVTIYRITATQSEREIDRESDREEGKEEVD